METLRNSFWRKIDRQDIIDHAMLDYTEEFLKTFYSHMVRNGALRLVCPFLLDALTVSI